MFSLWYFRRPPWDSGITPPELLEYLESRPAAGRAIDLGCGTGTNVITMARMGWQVTGVDFVPKAIDLAREKARKAGLRLDDRDLALKGGKSGKPAIAPGEPAVSELIARITAKNPDDVMPPPDTKKPLTAAEIETLRRWIASGAEYQKHWAFIPPERPALPASSAARTKSPVDAFVRARLKTEKLRPSPEAAP